MIMRRDRKEAALRIGVSVCAMQTRNGRNCHPTRARARATKHVRLWRASGVHVSIVNPRGGFTAHYALNVREIGYRKSRIDS